MSEDRNPPAAGFGTRVIRAATRLPHVEQAPDSVPIYQSVTFSSTDSAELVGAALNDRGKAVRGSRIGVLGVAFKPNVRDARNSPAADVLAELTSRGGDVSYHDPHVESFADAAGADYESRPLNELLADIDAVLVLVRHRDIDWPLVYERAQLVIDTVNSSDAQALVSRQVLRLGAGWS